MVARALLQAGLAPQAPPKVRSAALATARKLVIELINVADRSPQPARTWSDQFNFNLDVVNMWATTWALLTFVQRGTLADKHRRKLEAVLRRALLAHAAAAGENGLLPSRISEQGLGTGEFTFGTAMSVVAWRTLEMYGPSPPPPGHAGSLGSELALRRLVHSPGHTIELPSTRPDGDVLALEAYLAWAALLMAGASVGVRISGIDARRLVDLARTMDEAVRAAATGRDAECVLRRIVEDSGMFAPSLSDVVAASGLRVATFGRERDDDRHA